MTCTIISNRAELQLECKNEHEPPYGTIKFELYQIIMSLFTQGYDTFYLNCEYGIPLWAAEIICALKANHNIKLHIAVPYEEQSTNWVEEHRDRYFKVHGLADSVTIVNTQYHSDCYYEADTFMLENSDLLYVFGNSANTLESVRTAKELGVDILYV